jgi:hypothetical protein
MPNWCSNYTTFKGSKENIASLNDAINKAIERETAERQAQAIHSSEVKDGYFFDIFNNGIEHEELTISYDTRWSPNIDDLAVLCKEYGVDAETEFNEPGCQVHGVAWVYSDGTYTEEYVEQEFLDLIEYDIATDLYTYNGEEYEVFEEIIEDHYSTWKNNNL